MKKKIVIITSSILIAAASTAATLLALTQPQENNVTTSKAPQEPAKQEAVKESTPIVEAPQQAPQKAVEPSTPTIPTNEELIVQYGWGGYWKVAIDAIISMVPQFFVDDNRVSSFKYLQDVCNISGANITYCFTYMRDAGQNKIQSWVNLGKQAGVDTSRYE